MNDALLWFGQILHPSQDFYSHSNWVELGQTDIVDSGLGKWKELDYFTLVKGVMTVQGETFETPRIPARITGLSKDGSIVNVTTSSGRFRGLISGSSGPGDDDCPDRVTLSHDDLNKDHPSSSPTRNQAYLRATELAITQTRHEWCRLTNLVFLRYGQRGLDSLFNQWGNKPKWS